MRRVNLIIFIIITALNFFSSIYQPNQGSDISMIQPGYKALLKNTSGSVQSKEDFLFAILGSDERKNEKSRSDVIMLIKYVAEENKVIVVSVPRDCKISLPGKGTVKINAAYAYGGPALQVNVLENLFKVNDVRYVHINFEGFTKIVDTLGGIKINAEKDFIRDYGEEAIYAKKGENILMGDDLLEYVRFRHDSEGDFGRIKRQQEVLQSFAASILNPANIVKLLEIALLVAKNSDSDMDIFFIMKHLNKLRNLDSLEFEFYTLKTTSEKSNGIWYEIIDDDNLQLMSDLLRN